MKYNFLTLCLFIAFSVSAFGQGGRQRVTSILEIYDIVTGTRQVVREFNGVLIEAPNWTPDGKWLVYNSGGLLYKIPPDASLEPQVINTDFITACNNDHLVSFDGSFIIISAASPEDRRSRIYTLPWEGGVPQLVTPLGPSYLHGISPDGKFLAYCADRNGNYDVYVIPTQGGEERRLTTAEGFDDGPEYSPCGEYIWFNSERTGLMQVWRMKTDGSEQTQMTFCEDFNSWFPHVSPDGKQVVLIAYHEGDVRPGDHPANRNVVLRLMPAEGGTPRTIVELFGGQGTINVHSWAPDSRRFAFVSYRLEQPTAAATQTPAQFTNAGDVGNPRLAGRHTYNPATGVYNVTGGGVNMWENTDEFYFIWRRESGNFTLSTTLNFENKEGNAHKKMGLIIRESLDANAKYADIAIHADGLTSLQYRAETGGITREVATALNGADRAVLIRRDNKIIIRAETGAVPRVDIAEIELDFPGEFYVGMFVCSHEADRLETADFSDVRFTRQ